MANIWWIVFCCTIPGLFCIHASTRIRLDKVTLKPTAAVVKENDNASFTCRLDLNKLNVSSWNVIVTISGTSVLLLSALSDTCNSSSDIPVNYRVSCDMKKNTINIVIRNVTRREHNITVRCIFRDTTNSVKEQKTSRVFVKVPVKEVIINTVDVLKVRPNAIKELECRSSYSRPAPNVSLVLISARQKYTRILTPSKDDKIENDKDLVQVTRYLNYSPKVADDKGVLFCEASNDDRIIVRSPNVTISVTYEPNILDVKVSGRKKDSQGTFFNVSCTANGNPVPDISWLSKNMQMTLQKDAKSLTSVLKNRYIPCDADSHIFTCVAANNIGKSAMKDIKVPSKSCKETSAGTALTQTDIISTSVAVFMLIVAIIAIVIYLKCRKKPQNEEGAVNTEMPSRSSPPPIPAPRNNMEAPGRSNDYENAEIDDENVLYAHTRFQRRPPLNVKARSYNSLVLVHSIPRSREKLNATKLAALGGYSSESALDSICQGHSEPLRVVSKPEHNMPTPPMVAPRSRNYLHLDLPTESGNVIHGIGNRTNYSDVWFHASN